MSKGRKNGCPVNVKNWLIYIMDKATNEWVRIFGLTSMTRSFASETSDGSSDADDWEEPFVKKRSGTIKLEGKPVVVEATGEEDQGQTLVNAYADAVGCEADATLKFVDPYGHAWQGDYIITGNETSTDNDGTTLSWDLSLVGQIEVLPYVGVSAIALKDGEAAASTVEMAVGDAPKIITVDFTPDTASNTRFRVANNKRTVATVTNVTETGFTLNAMGAGTATIQVTSVSGGKSATMVVTVTDN